MFSKKPVECRVPLQRGAICIIFSEMEPNQFITHVGRVRSSTCTYTLPGLRNKDHEGIIAGQNFFPRGGDSTS